MVYTKRDVVDGPTQDKDLEGFIHVRRRKVLTGPAICPEVT